MHVQFSRVCATPGAKRPLLTQDEFIRQKVSDLFRSRRLDCCVDACGYTQRERAHVARLLAKLQYSVYRLDSYGESVWEVQQSRLSELWEEVYRSVQAWHESSHVYEPLLTDLRLYQDVEIGMRNGSSPTEIEIERFYWLKTCDVRLSRGLLAATSVQPGSSDLQSMWNYFDSVAEVLDDLSDLEEDSVTYNCNRFSISCALVGVRLTKNRYLAFLRSIAGRVAKIATQEPAIRTPAIAQVHRWLVEELTSAADLLRKVPGPACAGHLPS